MMMMGAIVPDLGLERTVNKFTTLFFLDARVYVLFDINLLKILVLTSLSSILFLVHVDQPHVP